MAAAVTILVVAIPTVPIRIKARKLLMIQNKNPAPGAGFFYTMVF
jgi:hypothetical protein